MEKITLIFPNYSIEPVYQKWSEKSLRMIPYFDTLFDWEKDHPKEIEMEVNPMVFTQIMKNVLTRDFNSELEALADYLCVDLEKDDDIDKNFPKKRPQVKTFFQDIRLHSTNRKVDLDISKCSEIRDVSYQSSDIMCLKNCKLEIVADEFIIDRCRRMDKTILNILNQKITDDDLDHISFKYVPNPSLPANPVIFKVIVNYIENKKTKNNNNSNIN